MVALTSWKWRCTSCIRPSARRSGVRSTRVSRRISALVCCTDSRHQYAAVLATASTMALVKASAMIRSPMAWESDQRWPTPSSAAACSYASCGAPSAYASASSCCPMDSCAGWRIACPPGPVDALPVRPAQAVGDVASWSWLFAWSGRFWTMACTRSARVHAERASCTCAGPAAMAARSCACVSSLCEWSHLAVRPRPARVSRRVPLRAFASVPPAGRFARGRAVSLALRRARCAPGRAAARRKSSRRAALAGEFVMRMASRSAGR